MFHRANPPAPEPSRPRLMGIVNVTPDSFSDGTVDPAAAADLARLLAAQGACMLDFGAEASSFFRPGIAPVPAEEQLCRLLPVLERLGDLPADVLISVDTRSAEVARAVLSAPGSARAAIINDISAGAHDPELLPTVAEHNAGVILMHMSPGYPATPAADDPDILATVCDYLQIRVQAALADGIARERIALDPGIGFGKTMADNWRLALRVGELAQRLDGIPLVIGASRKRFLETPPPPDVSLPPGWQELLARLQPDAAHPRDPASAALARLTADVTIHRVHNVALAAAR